VATVLMTVGRAVTVARTVADAVTVSVDVTVGPGVASFFVEPADAAPMPMPSSAATIATGLKIESPRPVCCAARRASDEAHAHAAVRGGQPVKTPSTGRGLGSVGRKREPTWRQQ
jgi:hypothetical protein